MSDEQDNPGIRVPPPPLYVLALLLGLLLDRRAHIPFLPRGVARVLGWPLVGGGMALAAWFVRTMGNADTTIRSGTRHAPEGGKVTVRVYAQVAGVVLMVMGNQWALGVSNTQ